MKGFVAACLAHVPAFQRARLKVPMHFAFCYDEEIGCLGAHSLVERLIGDVPRPQAVIVGEPTMMGVVNAQNAGGGIVATFTGFEAHSSMTHLGVSAIHFAGDFIHWLNELQVELARRKRTDIDTVPGHTTINVGIDQRRHRRQHPGARVHAELGLSHPARRRSLGGAAPRRAIHRRAAAAEDADQASRRQHRR